MVLIARIYLGLIIATFAAMGLLALAAPAQLMAQLDLLPKSPKGLAEIRALYGGAFLSWAVIMLAAWRSRTLGQGLWMAMALTMGAIAAARVVSLAIERQTAFNVPALIGEGLIALACWTLYRHEKRRAQKV
jgi:hypothetical protein